MRRARVRRARRAPPPPQPTPSPPPPPQNRSLLEPCGQKRTPKSFSFQSDYQDGPRRRLELAQQRPLQGGPHVPCLRQPLGPRAQVRGQHVQAVLPRRRALAGVRQVPLDVVGKGGIPEDPRVELKKNGKWRVLGRRKRETFFVQLVDSRSFCLLATRLSFSPSLSPSLSLSLLSRWISAAARILIRGNRVYFSMHNSYSG